MEGEPERESCRGMVGNGSRGVEESRSRGVEESRSQAMGIEERRGVANGRGVGNGGVVAPYCTITSTRVGSIFLL